MPSVGNEADPHPNSPDPASGLAEQQLSPTRGSAVAHDHPQAQSAETRFAGGEPDDEEFDLLLRVLGPTVIDGSPAASELRPRERDVLASLALDPSRPAHTERLSGIIWPDRAPATAGVTIQNHVARIRKQLGGDAVLTEPGGYRLGRRWVIDIARRSTLVDRSARWSRLSRPDLAVGCLDEALLLGRGPAFADLPTSPLVNAAQERQLEIGRHLLDRLMISLLVCDGVGRLVAQGRFWCDSEPFREVRWAALAVALYRDGQRREAVRTVHHADRLLRQRSGLNAGPMLRSIEAMVLDDSSILLSNAVIEALTGTSYLTADLDDLPDSGGSTFSGAVHPRIAPPTTDPGPAALRPAGQRPAGHGMTGNGRVGSSQTEEVVEGLAASLTTIGAVVAAAETAQEQREFADAATLWRIAAERDARRHGEASPTTLRLRLKRAQALRLAGDPACVGVVIDAAETSKHVGGEVFAEAVTELCRLGPSTEAGVLNPQIASLLESAIDGCAPGATRARCGSEAALFYSMSGHIDRAIHHFEQSLLDARRSGDERVLLDALGATYVIVTHPSDQQRRRALAAEMLGLAEKVGDLDAKCSALHLYFAAQLIDADPLLRTTFHHQDRLARALSSAGRRWMAAYQRACLAFLEGRLNDAERITEDAYATAPVSTSRAASTRWMMLLLIRTARGRAQDLADDIESAIAEQPGLPGWRAPAAWLAALRGDRSRVQFECRKLDFGSALPLDMAYGAAAMMMARAVARVGLAEAYEPLRTLIEPYSGMFSWYGSGTVGPFDLALAELAAAIGETDRAARHLEVAQRLVDRIGAVVFQPDLDAVRGHILDG